MGRLRLQSPGNYAGTNAISAEFESIVRYINSAELGDNTIGELLAKLFDTNGDFDGPIEFRADTTDGIQYRIGEYTDSSLGWQTLITYESLRGPTGLNVGTIEGPLFYNRQEIVSGVDQTEFDYTFDEDTDTILVYTNGVLEAEDNYTADSDNNTVTFDTARTEDDVITIYSVRTQNVTNYRRSDIIATAGQAVFAFVHDESEQLLVYVNGILQRSGGSNDYTSSAATDTVTFTSSLSENDLVSIITVENSSLSSVGGLMLEDEYTNSNGSIPYAKLAIADGDIPLAKVATLVAALTNVRKVFVSPTTPTGMVTGDLWLDTSKSPNQLSFYDGTQFILTSPESSIPAFTASNAGQFLLVNGTGTALSWGSVDFSSLVPKTYRGAANGVASLDSDAKIPTSQLPDIFATDTKDLFVAGSIANGTKFVSRLWKQTVQIDGIAFKLSSGTCDITISVDGVTVGATHNVTSTAQQVTLSTVIEIDATTTSRRLEIAITNNSSGADLEVGLAVATISS